MGINFKDVGAKAVSKAAELLFRQNQSMEDENGSVGAGLLAIHEDRAAEKTNVKRDKEKRVNDSHFKLMAQLQDRINDLQSQIDDLQNKIDKAQEVVDAATSAIEAIKNGEMPEQNADGSLKNKALEAALKEYEKKNGKIDHDDPAALMAALQIIVAEQEAAIQAYEDRQNGLQENLDEARGIVAEAELTGDDSKIQPYLEKSSTSELHYTGDSGSEMAKVVDGELNDRKDDGDSVNTDNELSGLNKDDLFGDFMDDDLFPAAEKLEIADNFARAASGEIHLPKPEQEITPQDPNQQISMNV